FVVKDFAADIVAHDAGALRNPNHTSVTTINLRLEFKNTHIVSHKLDKLGPTTWFDVELPGDISQVSNEFFWRRVAVHLRQGRICADVFALRCSLENPFEAILKDAPIFLLCSSQRL